MGSLFTGPICEKPENACRDNLLSDLETLRNIHGLKADLLGGRVGHARMRAAGVFGEVAAI